MSWTLTCPPCDLSPRSLVLYRFRQKEKFWCLLFVLELLIRFWVLLIDSVLLSFDFVRFAFFIVHFDVLIFVFGRLQFRFGIWCCSWCMFIILLLLFYLILFIKFHQNYLLSSGFYPILTESWSFVIRILISPVPQVNVKLWGPNTPRISGTIPKFSTILHCQL